MMRTLINPLLCLSILCVSCLGLNACSWLRPYQPNIQQGNILSDQMVSELRVGMSKEQVVRTLGNPISSTVLHEDHWIYAYTFQRNGGPITKKHLELYFQHNSLVRIGANYPLNRKTSPFFGENKI
jgi:outer membrane protein assembly factor BamE